MWESADNTVLSMATGLVAGGQVKSGMALVRELIDASPDFYISEWSYNLLCWNGGLWGAAEEVVEACRAAVALAPQNGDIADSYALVRAQLGEYDEAQDGFLFFIDWAGERGFPEEVIERRLAWVDLLGEKINPFDDQTLRELRAAEG